MGVGERKKRWTYACQLGRACVRVHSGKGEGMTREEGVGPLRSAESFGFCHGGGFGCGGCHGRGGQEADGGDGELHFFVLCEVVVVVCVWIGFMFDRL